MHTEEHGVDAVIFSCEIFLLALMLDTHIYTERQTDRQTHRETERQTERHRERDHVQGPRFNPQHPTLTFEEHALKAWVEAAAARALQHPAL